MRMRKLYCLLATLLVATASCNGQEKPTVQKVLSQKKGSAKTASPKLVKTQGSNEYGTVSCALQDKEGNIWFGTSKEGVYRYDGTGFLNFNVADGFTNEVRAIQQDSAGNIWFGGKEALYRYNGSIFTTVPLPVNNGLNYQLYVSAGSTLATKNELWSLFIDRSGTLWLGTTEGLYCSDGRRFWPFLDNQKIENKSGVGLKSIQSVFEDKAGNIWFAAWVITNEGVCRYNGKAITQFKPYGEGWVRSVVEDPSGHLFIVTRHNGICAFDGNAFVNFTEGSVNNAMADNAGNLWWGTELGSGNLNEDGGLWRYDGKAFTHFKREDGLCHNGVYCLLQDRSGKIWIGTRNTGLCRYDGKTFENFSE